MSFLISLITASYNADSYIEDSINSVIRQNGSKNIEYIIKDGNSTDKTVDIIKSYKNKVNKTIVTGDNGLYDALNTGIEVAQGDYIGILNSDDFLKNPNTLMNVESYLTKFKPDCLIGDVEIVDQVNTSKIKRRYSAKSWTPSLFKYGIMPPHPAVYLKRELFEKYGYYKLDYKIAADFELLVRFLWKYKISYKYIPETIVTMRHGGMSNQGFFKSKRLITKEILKACKENGLYTNNLLLNLRYLLKLKQLF
ncbi:MAG: glycosyltransferase family 2 protein [bacterium]